MLTFGISCIKGMGDIGAPCSRSKVSTYNVDIRTAGKLACLPNRDWRDINHMHGCEVIIGKLHWGTSLNYWVLSVEEFIGYFSSLHWRHNEHDRVSNHQPHDCLLNRLFRRRSEKISKLRVTGLCAGNSPETGEFPAQIASYAENVSIWWRHHVHRLVSNAIVWCIVFVRFNKSISGEAEVCERIGHHCSR